MSIKHFFYVNCTSPWVNFYALMFDVTWSMSCQAQDRKAQHDNNSVKTPEVFITTFPSMIFHFLENI